MLIGTTDMAFHWIDSAVIVVCLIGRASVFVLAVRT